MCPLSRRPCNAVSAATGTEAACSNVKLSGLMANPDSGAHTYSAEGPFTDTEHFVAWLEPHYALANCFHLAGHINAGSCEPWLAQSEQYAKAVRLAFHQTCIQWIDGSHANFYQDFIVLGNGPFEVLDLNNDVRRSVSGVDGSFHRDGTIKTGPFLPQIYTRRRLEKSHFLCRYPDKEFTVAI